MRETTFYIVLNLKTCNGNRSFGKFFIGNNRKNADVLFRQLKGKKDVDDETVLSLDLIESRDGLPYNMDMISCSLEEMAENCKIIAREIFIHYNLEKQ